MQPGSLCVVLDLDLRAELTHEAVERGPFSRAHVRRRHDSEGDTAFSEATQLLLEQSNAVPLHEGAEEVDTI